MEIEINNTKFVVFFSNNNIHIRDSYLIKNDEDKIKMLDLIMGSDEYAKGNHNRSRDSYLIEWKAHNVLYEWGIAPSRTASVDLNEDESLFRRICYFFLSKLEKKKVNP